MKKQLYLTIVSICILQQRTSTMDEKPNIARMKERTDEERQAYLEKKINNGVRLETDEFRFVLKLAEYLDKLQRGVITQDEFDRIVNIKIGVYLGKKPEGQAFVDEYRSLSLDELEKEVGTKEEPGLMKRYKDETL